MTNHHRTQHSAPATLSLYLVAQATLWALCLYSSVFPAYSLTWLSHFFWPPPLHWGRPFLQEVRPGAPLPWAMAASCEVCEPELAPVPSIVSNVIRAYFMNMSPSSFQETPEVSIHSPTWHWEHSLSWHLSVCLQVWTSFWNGHPLETPNPPLICPPATSTTETKQSLMLFLGLSILLRVSYNLLCSSLIPRSIGERQCGKCWCLLGSPCKRKVQEVQELYTVKENWEGACLLKQ